MHLQQALAEAFQRDIFIVVAYELAEEEKFARVHAMALIRHNLAVAVAKKQLTQAILVKVGPDLQATH